jgi:hypothetical protein
MGTLNNKRWQLLRTTLATLALGLTAAACGDDDGERSPGGGTNINLDAGGNNPIDGGIGLDATVNTGSDGGSDGAVQQPSNSDCKGANGCYSCKPSATTTSPELLNSCATGCVPFDNKARIQNFTGTLPRL